MADIDHFKKVNDTYGHNIGDRLLCDVAQTLARQCRETDFPARFGGEEFAIVVSGERQENASNLAERCRQELEQYNMTANGQIVNVTISFGVCDNSDAGSIEEVVEQADKALYKAKEAGRNRVECFAAACSQGVRAQDAAPQA